MADAYHIYSLTKFNQMKHINLDMPNTWNNMEQ